MTLAIETRANRNGYRSRIAVMPHSSYVGGVEYRLAHSVSYARLALLILILILILY